MTQKTASQASPSLPTPSLAPMSSSSSERTLAQQGNEPTEKQLKEPAATSEPTQATDVVAFDGPDDPYNPQNWSFSKKVWQTALVAGCTLWCTFAASVFASGTQEVAAEFGVGSEVAILGTSLYLVGFAVGPPLWGPMSEFLGRRIPLLVSFGGLAVFSIMSAVGTNIQTVLIGRFLQGLCGTGPISVSAGCLVDFFSPTQRAPALILFSLAVFGGTTIGPVMGNFIAASYLGWRWLGYLQLIVAFAILAILVLFHRESYAPTLLQSKARKLRFEMKNWALHAPLDEKPFDPKAIVTVYLLRPIAMLVQEPILAITTAYTALAYGLLFAQLEAIAYVYGDLRGFSVGSTGLVFLAIMVGLFVATATALAFTPRYNRVLKERGVTAAPDERCLPMMVGGFFFSTGLLIFAWTSPEYVSTPWPSMLGLLLVGAGFQIIFMSSLNITIDCYLALANSAWSANGMVRSFAAVAFPLFTRQMLEAMTVHWGMSMLAFVSIALLPFPFVFRAYTRPLLARSKYATQPDLPKDAKQKQGA